MYICSWEPFYTRIGNIVPTLFIYFNREPVFFRHPNYYRNGLLLQSTKPNQQYTISWYVDIPSQHWHTRHSGQISSRPHTTKSPNWWFSEEHPFISGKPKLVKCEFIWPENIHTLHALLKHLWAFLKDSSAPEADSITWEFSTKFSGISRLAMKKGPLVLFGYRKGFIWVIMENHPLL